MGYFWMLLFCISSLYGMEEGSSGKNRPEKVADLLMKIQDADVEAVRACLLHGVRPHSRVIDSGRDTQHFLNDFATAVTMIDNEGKRFEILRLLLEYGMNPNDSVQFGEETPKKMPMLSYVINKFGRKTLPRDVLLLVAYDANVDESDCWKNSPFYHAWRTTNTDILTLLRLSGADSIKPPHEDHLKEEIHILLTNIEEYKRQHPEECDALVHQIDELRAERQSRKKKLDEQFSVDHDIPRSPRKGSCEDSSSSGSI